VTPPAATAAGRGKKASKRAASGAGSGAKRAASAVRGGLVKPPGSSARATGRVSGRHAAPAVRRTAAPRTPRRVSGPAGGRSGVGRAATALAVALPRPHVAPLGPRLVAFATTLPDRSIVDRMVRGRVWIGVLGFLLIGLVTMQVSLLKLNAGMGRAVERSSALERANGELRAQVSQLESGERIQQNAAALGMVMPPAGQISYLRSARGTGTAAAALRDGRFNDPAKAIPLPGTGTPPDPLAAALAAGHAGANGGQGASTGDGTATSTGSTTATTATAPPGSSSGGDGTSTTTSSGSGESTAQAGAAAGGTTPGQ
jgi:hypothetical protein